MLLQLCVLWCLVSVVCAENNNESDNSTISRRDSVELDSCKNVGNSLPSVVAVLSSGVEVMCDAEDGGGWTVIQRRTTGKLDFYRGWEDYKYGFGDLDGEFWLGNEFIHRLTIQRRYELRVEFTYKNNSYYAGYARFRVYGEAEFYKLKVSGYSGGNAGDSLSAKSNDMKFTTNDKDNDRSGGQCAQSYHGAWWYNSCHDSNLNGKWNSTERLKGVIWTTVTGELSSVNSTEMKIRPI